MRKAKESRYFDVLIVGAGPAGSSAAKAAAEAGASVLVVDKRRRIGKPVQCAEFIPRLLVQSINLPPPAIAQEIEGMTTFMPDGEVLRRRAPGFVLNRADFDQALALEATGAGVKILTQTKAVSREGNAVRLCGPSGEDMVSASVVIGADGPDSVVGSWIGQSNTRVMTAMQHTVVLKEPARDTEVYFHRQYPGGYAWLFPKGRVANVGVGIQRGLGGSARRSLAAFKEKIRDRIGEVVAVTAGRIPVGGPHRSIDERARIILAGDAAGHTHAITGGGIPQAVICGAMAGSAAAAAAGGDERAFQRYHEQWRSAFGSMMDKGAKRRRQLEAGWNNGHNFGELLRKCWVACEEYHNEA